MSSLGVFLRDLRLKSSYSQEYVAQWLGYKSVVTLSKIENDEYIPNGKTLETILDIYEASNETKYKLIRLSFELKLPERYHDYLHLIEKYSKSLGKKDAYSFLDEDKIKKTIQKKYSSIYDEDTAKILSSSKMIDILNKLTQIDKSKRDQALDTFLILLKGIE